MYNKPTSPLTQVLHVDYEPQKKYQGFPDPSEGAKKAVLCGAFRLEHPGAFPLQHSLPKVIHIPAEQGRMVQSFTEIVQLIAREAAAPRPGAEVMLRRLTELLFIQIIRIWVEQQTGDSTGWVAALRDQSISTALGLIHQSPERGWKVHVMLSFFLNCLEGATIYDIVGTNYRSCMIGCEKDDKCCYLIGSNQLRMTPLPRSSMGGNTALDVRTVLNTSISKV